MSKRLVFQTIQFNISTQFSFIWPVDRTLPGAITPGQSAPERDGNKCVLCIPQHYWNFTIIFFSVIFRILVRGVLPLCREAFGLFYRPIRLGKLSLSFSLSLSLYIYIYIYIYICDLCVYIYIYIYIYITFTLKRMSFWMVGTSFSPKHALT